MSDAPIMALSVAELRALSEEQLVARHDSEMKSYAHGDDFYLSELWRREVRRSSDSAEHFASSVAAITKTLVRLTWLIAFLTAVNVVAAFMCWRRSYLSASDALLFARAGRCGRLPSGRTWPATD